MTMYPPSAHPGQGAVQHTCTWHPDRATALSCSRCGRPACPECLAPASVGFHCRACVAEARGVARANAPRTVVGARTVSGAGHGLAPRITYAIIGINLALFVGAIIQSGSASEFGGSSIFNESLLVPAAVASGQWWRIVASGFMHLSVTHIALNMLSLYFIGTGMERVMGAWRYLSLYLLSLLGGSACVMLFAGPMSGAAGASGAIFGLMGALLVTLKRLKLDMRQAGVVIAINVFATFAIPGISWQAHLGGLVVGSLVGAALVYAPAAKRQHWQVGAIAVVGVLLIAAIVVRVYILGDWTCATVPGRGIGCVPPSFFGS